MFHKRFFLFQSLKKEMFKCIDDENHAIAESLINCNCELLNAKTEDKDEDEETPIVYAAKKRKEDIVVLLAKKYPNISIKSKSGKGLLDYLQYLEKKAEIVEILDKVNDKVKRLFFQNHFKYITET